MSRISLSAALRSGKGLVRSNNEDAYYFNGAYPELKNMDQETALASEFHDGQALFAICDGMGGYENGEVASYTAVSNMPRLQRTLLTDDFAAAVTRWVDETNSAVIEAARDGGCTLALLFFHTGKVYIAHIGDSRVYRYSRGRLSRMTKDHSKLQVLLDAGIITEQEAETYPHKHVITRALGMDEEENGKCIPAVREPVFAESQDWYIICSDGVTDMLADARIESLVSRARTAGECAETVYQAALDAGGKDNASVIAVRVGEADHEPDRNDKEGDPLESTWTPEAQASDAVSIEQLTTIRQANGQKVTIKTRISGSGIGVPYVPLN